MKLRSFGWLFVLAPLGVFVACGGEPAGTGVDSNATTGSGSTESASGGSAGTDETGASATEGGSASTSTSGSASSGDPTGSSGETSGTSEETTDGTSTGETTGVDEPPIDRARILFSGHSLLDVAVPDLRVIAMDHGDDVADLFQTIPGSPIRVRTRGAAPDDENSWDGYAEGAGGLDVVSELRTPTVLPAGDHYDTLVITERHDILGTVQWESTVSLLRHYHDRLLESSADGTTYFYQSWLDIDKADPQTWLDYEAASITAWECVTNKVNLTLEADGLPATLRTLPAGFALARLVEEALAGNIPGVAGSDQEILDAIFSDNVHLTDLGRHYAGAVTYADVFHRTPENASTPAGLTDETAAALQALAWESVQAYHDRPDGGLHTMEECRGHISQAVCEPFWTGIFDNPGQVQNCQNFFGGDVEGNPFRWPDPDLVVWPVPG